MDLMWALAIMGPCLTGRINSILKLAVTKKNACSLDWAAKKALSSKSLNIMAP